ncbi:MAG: squalene--hopene cyclase, partial [Planctomycetes bacterium]|nr:squalene--hopene cyclase [Planctomycetota bacterium]
LPHWLLRLAGVPVVSYALAALIAIGLAGHVRKSPKPVLLGWLKRAVTPALLRRLEAIQPASGGFLEAVPLTGFVTVSLLAAGRGGHAVASRGLEFILATQRDNGAWPIDVNLSVWNTTMAVAALGGGDEATRDWLIDRQQRKRHPYTHSPPGGWGWSHLPGSIGDADDSAGAMLALAAAPPSEEAVRAALAGAEWLIGLQNRDGGWPTFCRGWGKLTFDRSASDLTAHAMQALHRWRTRMNRRLGGKADRAVARGLEYLRRSQRQDRSWPALWFGSQHTADQSNPVFGTSRVLRGYRALGLGQTEPARRGRAYLLGCAGANGGWGAAALAPPTIEETAAAVEALADGPSLRAPSPARAGVNWLCEQIAGGGLDRPSPIGLYFARLWYHERPYPICLAAGALRSAVEAAV